SDRPPEARENHGSYDDGMNHDSYVRPRWDEAYVFSYCASLQWIESAKDWVAAVNPAFWEQLRTFKGYAGLTYDQEAGYRLSEWLDFGGHNGSWKGPGSGYK